MKTYPTHPRLSPGVGTLTPGPSLVSHPSSPRLVCDLASWASGLVLLSPIPSVRCGRYPLCRWEGCSPDGSPLELPAPNWCSGKGSPCHWECNQPSLPRNHGWSLRETKGRSWSHDCKQPTASWLTEARGNLLEVALSPDCPGRTGNRPVHRAPPEGRRQFPLGMPPGRGAYLSVLGCPQAGPSPVRGPPGADAPRTGHCGRERRDPGIGRGLEGNRPGPSPAPPALALCPWPPCTPLYSIWVPLHQRDNYWTHH